MWLWTVAVLGIPWRWYVLLSDIGHNTSEYQKRSSITWPVFEQYSKTRSFFDDSIASAVRSISSLDLSDVIIGFVILNLFSSSRFSISSATCFRSEIVSKWVYTSSFRMSGLRISFRISILSSEDTCFPPRKAKTFLRLAEEMFKFKFSVFHVDPLSRL